MLKHIIVPVSIKSKRQCSQRSFFPENSGAGWAVEIERLADHLADLIMQFIRGLAAVHLQAIDIIGNARDARSVEVPVSTPQTRAGSRTASGTRHCEAPISRDEYSGRAFRCSAALLICYHEVCLALSTTCVNCCPAGQLWDNK